MDWNSSHLFVSGRNPLTQDSVYATQHVSQMLNDINSSKDRKGPQSPGSPTMKIHQHISQGRMNGLKTSQTPVTKPLCQGSPMQMVSLSFEAMNKSMMSPISGGLVQNITCVQEPAAPFGVRKVSGFAHNPPVISLPFICGPFNDEYFQPTNCTPYGITNQSFLSHCDGSSYQPEKNFTDPIYFNYCNSTNLNPPKRSYKLNPEAAEYIPKIMRLTDQDSWSPPPPVSVTHKKDTRTTSMTDQQHIAVMAQSPTSSSCEDGSKNALVTQHNVEKKGKSVLCCSDSKEVSTACHVPSSVNIKPVVIQNKESCGDSTQKNEMNAASITLDRNTPGGSDVEKNSSSMKVPCTKLDMLGSCIIPSSLESTAKNPLQTETDAVIASRLHSLHSNIENNNCALVNTHNPSSHGNQSAPLSDPDDSGTSDEDDDDDCDSSSSDDDDSNSSSDDESENDTDDLEEEDDDDDGCVYFKDDDDQYVDPSKSNSTEHLCESNKLNNCLKKSEAEGTKEKDYNAKETDFVHSLQAGSAILSYIVGPTSISDDSHASEEEEEEEDYDCELFNLELDDAWIIPMGSLFLSNIISGCTGKEISEKPKESPNSSNMKNLVDEVDASEIHGESTTLNDDKVNAEMEEDWQRSTTRKVTFSDHVETHLVEYWQRRGPWEECARDRMRFRARIDEMESVLEPVLNPAHRWKVFQRLK